MNRLRTAQALVFALGALAIALPAHADTAADVAALKVAADTVWTLLTGALVFIMNAGFAFLESGLCRAKNTVNILSKNFVITAIGGLGFYMFGFALMFGDGSSFIGTSGLFLMGADNSPAVGDAYQGVFASLNWTGIPLEAKFFFQACFVMAAASIVSGAVAERIKFHAYIFFSIILVCVIYPITGHWIWGGGWLAGMGFWDFAGSTQVHSVGGWAALTGILLLGPRRGRYDKDGKVRPIPGHSMPLATLGTFILWLGWFGFNAGSTMAADAGAIAHICTTTLVASLGGTASALVANYFRVKTFDLTMMLNGCLAGLVAITAGCAFVGTLSSLWIGLLAGVIVVFAVPMFDRFKIDDPVGATSVHLLCGMFGTAAVGLFAEKRFVEGTGDGLFFGGGAKLLIAQLTGIGAVAAFVAATSFAVWFVLNKVMGLRVTDEEEAEGLDISEMGLEAYPHDAQTPAMHRAAHSM